MKYLIPRLYLGWDRPKSAHSPWIEKGRQEGRAPVGKGTMVVGQEGIWDFLDLGGTMEGLRVNVFLVVYERKKQK